MRKKTIRKKRRSKRPSLYRMVHGKKIQRIFTMKSRSSRLTGNRLRIKSVKYIRKAVMLCAGVTAAGLLFLGTQAQAAGETGQFRSRGVIHYTNAEGQEIILDAQDLQVLFQYAAEGKGDYPRRSAALGRS